VFEELVIFALSTLAGLGCLGIVAWTILNPETLDADKVFSIAASLVVALVFFRISVWMLFRTRLRELLRTEQPALPQPQNASARKSQQVPQAAGRAS